MQLVRRTLDVMRLLGRSSEGLGVSAIADQLDAAPSSVHRLLAVLVDERFVVQDSATKRYLLGPGVLPLSRAFTEQNPLERIARSHLEALRDTTRESAFLARMVGDIVVCVASAVSSRPTRFFMQVGEQMPFHAAASARAILAYQPDEEIRRLLDLNQPFELYTELTPVDRGEIMETLAAVRDRGFDVSVGLVEDGVGAIAVPVAVGQGEVTASLALVAPESRITSDLSGEYLEQLHKTADAIASEFATAGD